MFRRALLFAIALGLSLMPGPGGIFAAEPGAAPNKPGEAAQEERINLSPSERQVLFTSITSKKHVSTAAPPDFLPTAGAVVPESVELQPIPDAALKLLPQLKGYVCALVANQALIVDPQSRRIVEIVNEDRAPAPARS
ncbi:MAG TPA: DUF1236 domain-containing protein [Xanthobacteraceae bacterium]|nr:DUF1236 domain-containing protein [Xanthobacteraceae bacterium]